MLSSLSVTPPHAVGLANGVAQSIVSLARCFGPVLGGYVSHKLSFPRSSFLVLRSSFLVPMLLIDSCFSSGQLVRKTTHRDIPLDSLCVVG
jgi:hypothetical protein